MSILCYHCCHPCNTKSPLQIPRKYDPTSDSYLVEGYFCSWECMKTWNAEQNDSITNIRFSLIQEVYQKQFGIPANIKFSPRKHNLKCFGGNLTHENFKKIHNTIQEFNFPIIQIPLISETNLNIIKTTKKPSFLETSMGITKS